MNRIEERFEELKKQSKKAFIPFITAGDPDLATTRALVLELEKSCLLYTSPSPRDQRGSRMPSSA